MRLRRAGCRSVEGDHNSSAEGVLHERRRSQTMNLTLKHAIATILLMLSPCCATGGRAVRGWLYCLYKRRFCDRHAAYASAG